MSLPDREFSFRARSKIPGIGIFRGIRCQDQKPVLIFKSCQSRPTESNGDTLSVNFYIFLLLISKKPFISDVLHFSPIVSETRQNFAYFGKVSSKLKGAFLRSQKTSFCVGELRGRDFLITNRCRISTKSLVQNFRTF